MLSPGFIAVAIGLRLIGGGRYLISTLRGKVAPNIVSWSLWSLTAFIAFAAQVYKGEGLHAVVTLAIAIGPLTVVAAAVLRGRHSLVLTRLDVWCLSLAIAGIILWITTKNSLLALLISIVADIFASIPTLVKSYLTPHTESAAAYSLSIISMIVALLTVTQWNVLSWAFPSYILVINLTFVVLILLPKRLRYQRPASAIMIRYAFSGHAGHPSEVSSVAVSAAGSTPTPARHR
jgi:hypothetical protein